MPTEAHRDFYSAVFFDMDGLMVDSEPEWFQSEIEVTRPFGYTWTEADQVACLGDHYPEWADTCRISVAA